MLFGLVLRILVVELASYPCGLFSLLGPRGRAFAAKSTFKLGDGVVKTICEAANAAVEGGALIRFLIVSMSAPAGTAILIDFWR